MGRRKARVSDLVFKFYRLYRELWKEKYRSNSSTRLNTNISSKVKDLFSDIGYIEAIDRLDRFFENDDKWLLEKHHPMQVFIATADAYCSAKGKKNGKAKKIQRSKFDVRKELGRC